MQSPLRPHLLKLAATLVACLGAVSCTTQPPEGPDYRNKMVVSVKDQEMLLVSDGIPIKSYKVSTSKFGLGDQPGSYRTPLGRMQVAKKVGHRAPLGSVFKSCRPTGEILRPNAPGRDPIVTRILWLKGSESRNRNAYKRRIYIHGTTEEKRLGQAVSYGCIRMASRDVRDLYNRVGWGADVFVIKGSIKDKSSNGAVALLQRLSGTDEG
ncbi:MAG: L,D-transpeptidase [Akkermansiaceae bacterium]|nr:L,D-transpeptidase [Akkermansiaceae bacterium]